MRQKIGALRGQPLVQEIVGEPFPQHHLDRLLQPGLPDHENKEPADDHEEAAELANLLLDQAHILDGEVPADPAAFARRLNTFVVRGLGKNS